jgi:hypothetical protein
MAHQLRIYRGPCEESATKPAPITNNSPNQVTVSVDEVLPLLADAVASQRTWLKDFKDDEITISADLYEVLLAYQIFMAPGIRPIRSTQSEHESGRRATAWPFSALRAILSAGVPAHALCRPLAGVVD